MTKLLDKPANEKTAASDAAVREAATPAGSPPVALPQQIKINDSKVAAMYANFCRVTGTPEELIVDFGLNPQPFGVPSEPVELSQRIVVNFFTAKRLLAALQMSVQRHEAAFGVLETDVQKRVMPGAFRQPAPRA